MSNEQNKPGRTVPDVTVCRPASDDAALAWIAANMSSDDMSAAEVFAALAELPGGIGAPLQSAAPVGGTVSSTAKVNKVERPCRRFNGTAATLTGRTVVVGGTRERLADGTDTVVGGVTMVDRLIAGNRAVKANGLHCTTTVAQSDGTWSVKAVLRHLLADEREGGRQAPVEC